MSVSLIVIRAIYFTALLQLFGLLNFGLFFLPIRRRWLFILTALVFLASLAWLAMETTMMSGEAISRGTLSVVLRETRFGELWVARAILLVVLFALLPWRSRISRIVAILMAGAVLVLTADTGHAGADGNAFHVAADSLHLLAVGAWLGGLIPFALAMSRVDVGAIAWRFSTLGTVCVCVILATGGTNAWFLVGNLHALIGTPYGRLLLVKIALFIAMVAIAAVNRFRLTPRGAIGALRRNALIETALGLTIVIIVSALGTMPPAFGEGTQ